MSRITTNRSLTERSLNLKRVTHLAILLTVLSLSSLIHLTSGFRTTSGVPRKLFGGYRITPKQCRATKTLPSTDPRSKGPTICMFNHECAQRNGEVVGACMDGFLFGACCQVPKTQQPESTLINDAQNAYYQQYQQHKIQQQESETNKLVSQAYETFAENSAQAQSQSQESAYGPGSLTEVSQLNDESQGQLDTSEQEGNINADTSTEITQTSSSTEIDYSAQSNLDSHDNTSREPPKIYVQSNSVNSSSHSNSQFSQNDDLNSLPPDEDSHLTFTTEIPTKIVNSLTEQISSESDSFEEDHAVNRPLQAHNSDGSENTKHQTQGTDTLHNSDAVENDLQLSTGYGPPPVFVPAPVNLNVTYAGSAKPSSSYDGTTTSSSITTHVDSIETIIQQLNNSNPGPAYNVINPQSSTFAYEVVNATNAPTLDYNQEQPTKYNEVEQNDKQTSTTLYGISSEEPSSTNVHYADELVLEDHTMPESNYNDHKPSAHLTSDFNKMPVMGIAYPVDMSHMEDNTNSAVSDDKNVQSSYTASGQQMVNVGTQQSHINANKPYPMATYIGVVTSQSYNQPQVPTVPHEVVVSSHTTKVEGNLDSSVEYRPITTTINKISTSAYQPTTLKPVKNSSRPNLVTKKPSSKKPSKTSSNKIVISTSPYSTIPVESQTETHYTSQSYNPSANSYYHETILSGSTTKPVATRKPTKKQTVKPVSTSYVTGPTSPRPASTVEFSYDSEPAVIATDDKLDSFVHSTAQSLASATNAQESPLYSNPGLVSADTPVPVLRPQNQYNVHKKPGFVKIPATQRPPSPTVLITPKPTVLNTVGSSYSAIQLTTPTPLSSFGSTSYIYSPLVTRRPGFGDNSGGDYIGITTVNSNDFDDPGYYGTPDHIKVPQHMPEVFMQSSTENIYSVPTDDKPAFPGYYGPTPTYPAFPVPGEKFGSQAEEETYTSPNDFVNFPPVRNPNLNMSAASSAVTSDFELSTPAFVEDTILKNKMNTLVHKIVESLQGNFEALADIIDESNNTAPVLTYQAPSTNQNASAATKKPTRKPGKVTTTKPKATTKKPLTRVSTKAPTKKTATTRKPEATTKKTAVRRTTTTTRKPATRKPTRKITTTTKSPTDDELVDEEDEEDVNPSENEINEEDEAQYGAGAGGRKLQCGVRPHIKSGRIVGGKGATFGAYPWQVLVRESTWLGLFTKNKCGGVLITNRYVITAAHCQPGFLASLVAVMGEFDISGDLESKRATTKNVKRVIVHRQYDPATFENDIALLELESSVQFDTHIVPICMPSDVADFTGRMATVTGWGRLKYGGGVPSVLQEVQVPVIENSVCQEMFHTAGHNKKILNSFLCAGYANGQKDSCEGDSGGPLVLQRADGRYELAGTVSHGIKCAAPYLPGVYMRTTFYKPWLRSITGVK